MVRRKGDQLRLFRRRGKRRGAGRKPKGIRAGAAHKTRAKLLGRHPVHVVLRAAKGVGNLRRRGIYLAIGKAVEFIGDRDDFRIVHLSIQHNHVHLLVEAADERALSWHLQRFQVSAAKRINAVVKDSGGARRRGSVFPDRYHATVIKTPRQARHALAYCLNNWLKHGEHRSEVARGWMVDFFSSAVSFTEWVEYHHSAFPRSLPNGYAPLCVSPARTWLLQIGWVRGGPPISCFEAPKSTGK